MSKSLSLVVVLMAVPACGSSSSSGSPPAQGSATVNGSVNGQSVPVTDVIGLTGANLSDAGTGPYAYASVVLSNTTGTCGRAPHDVWSGGPGYEVLVIDAVVPGHRRSPRPRTRWATTGWLSSTSTTPTGP